MELYFREDEVFEKKERETRVRETRREIFVGTKQGFPRVFASDATIVITFVIIFAPNSTNREITERSGESCSPSFLLARVCNGAPSNLLPKSCFRSRIRDYGENLLGLPTHRPPPTCQENLHEPKKTRN